MRPRESSVEDYLCDRVKELGGEVRKVSWIGRKSAPDRLLLLNGQHPLVEVKRPPHNGKREEPRPDQLREHVKLRAAGFEVHVVDTKEGVDILLASIMEKTDDR